MKRVAIVYTAVLLSWISDAFSQNQTRFYYPLNSNDFWEYRYYLNGVPFSYLTRKVRGDTLMPNGKVYQIVQEYSPPFGARLLFQRHSQDSTEVFQFYLRLEPPNQRIPDEFLLYKLDIKVGDSWKYPVSSGSDSATFEVVQIADTSLWSSKFKFAHLSSSEVLGSGYKVLVDSIGVFYELFEGAAIELLGAKINNRKYGTFIFTSVRSFEDASENVVPSFISYPNPFNHAATLEYKLQTSGRVRITIFSMLGERVKIIDDSFKTPGFYRTQWFGKNEAGEPVSSGIYVYVITVNEMLIAKETILFLK